MELIKKIQEVESEINEKLNPNNVVVRILGDEDETKGKIIILQDGKINRGFKIEGISYCQINIIENNRKIEQGLFIDNLGKWIFNLYNSIEYQYVFYGGELNRKVLKRGQIEKIAIGSTACYEKERKLGICAHRKELDNQPIVRGYLGPMFEKIDYGKIYLRYETQEVYDMLSE